MFYRSYPSPGKHVRGKNLVVREMNQERPWTPGNNLRVLGGWGLGYEGESVAR